jgi:1-hydroxycarotenoid 3,4-desaturase
MRSARVAVIGAGIAGLVATLELACKGFDVVLLERAAAPGGKMREVVVAGRRMDAGPTVFTLRRVFDEIFEAAGESLDANLKLISASVLARHAWNSDEHLDLYSDLQRSADAIGRFAGKREAQGFLRFAAQAQKIYLTLNDSFMRAARPSPLELVRRVGFRNLGDLWSIQAFASMASSIRRYFKDPRLAQLFGRYATYCGSSPFQSPATLMLVAHVEQAGVWYVEGGMHQLAERLASLAQRKGASIRYGADVTEIQLQNGRVSAVQVAGEEPILVDAVVCNADNNALASGLFGADLRAAVPATPLPARSLSALTWNLVARAQGFSLAHHTVFFSADYRAEFDDIFRRRRLPSNPTVYVCAQDRKDSSAPAETGLERLLCLVNAPPTGDAHSFEPAEIDQCETRTFDLLRNCGLHLEITPNGRLATSPTDFNRLFPSTGGALYGPASHGWRTSFTRPGSRSAIPGLYLAGGSTHPGPGVPMAAISGRLAAASLVQDYDSIARYPRAATRGGTSMP